MIYRRSDWRFERTQSRNLASIPWAQPASGWLARLSEVLRGDAYRYPRTFLLSFNE